MAGVGSAGGTEVGSRTLSIAAAADLEPVLEALRDKSRYKGACGSCGRWDDCRGCRAIAYAYSKSRGEDDFLAEDPQCFIETAGS